MRNFKLNKREELFRLLLKKATWKLVPGSKWAITSVVDPLTVERIWYHRDHLKAKATGNAVVISTRCPVCHKANPAVSIPFENYIRWMEGEEDWKALHDHTNADERESLISGLCPKCWDKLLPF